MRKKPIFTTIIIFITMINRLLAFTPPDPEDLRTKADAGDADAQAMLGESYARGEWGLQTDYKMALKYLLPAAKQGHPVAYYNLGRMYNSGLGVEKDQDKGIQFFVKAFPGLDRGKDTADPRWLQNLGYLYGEGIGTEKDPEASHKLSLQAAEQGYARAQFDVGSAYWFGRGVLEDKSAARKWLLLAAEQGFAEAQCNLGLAYLQGTGVQEDKKWLILAAEQGHTVAQYNLGLAYLRGAGVREDKSAAVEWFRLAAEQGHARARSQLGNAYWDGTGVRKDKSTAMRWFNLAAEQGDANAQVIMGVFYKVGEGHIDKDLDEALKWFKLSADQGNVEALKQVEELTPEKTIHFSFEETKGKSEKQKGQTLVFKGFYLGMPIMDAQGLVNYYMGLKQVSATPIKDKNNGKEGNSNENPASVYSEFMLQAIGSQVQGVTHESLRAAGLNDDFINALGVTDPDAPYRVYSRNRVLIISNGAHRNPFAVADPSGKITKFELSSKIIQKFFGSMPVEEFLQSFVNAYDISGLEADRLKITATIMGITKEIGFQRIYRHRSDKGYEVIYYAESVIFEDDMKTFADTPPEGSMTIQKIETAKQRESKFD